MNVALQRAPLVTRRVWCGPPPTRSRFWGEKTVAPKIGMLVRTLREG